MDADLIYENIEEATDTQEPEVDQEQAYYEWAEGSRGYEERFLEGFE